MFNILKSNDLVSLKTGAISFRKKGKYTVKSFSWKLMLAMSFKTLFWKKRELISEICQSYFCLTCSLASL